MKEAPDFASHWYMTNEHPKAVQDILSKLDEILTELKSSQKTASQQYAAKRERNPRS